MRCPLSVSPVYAKFAPTLRCRQHCAAVLFLHRVRIVSVRHGITRRMRAVIPMVNRIPFRRAMGIVFEAASIANAVVVDLAAIGEPFGYMDVVRAAFRACMHIHVRHDDPLLSVRLRLLIVTMSRNLNRGGCTGKLSHLTTQKPLTCAHACIRPHPPSTYPFVHRRESRKRKCKRCQMARFKCERARFSQESASALSTLRPFDLSALRPYSQRSFRSDSFNLIQLTISSPVT